jgi:glutaredoxin
MLFSSLWLRWFPAARPAVQVVLYTRTGCHLCDDAHAVLEQARRRHGFALAAIDVDSDPELVALHGEWIPVVTVNGKVRFRGGVNRVLLERLLNATAV